MNSELTNQTEIYQNKYHMYENLKCLSFFTAKLSKVSEMYTKIDKSKNSAEIHFVNF